MSKKISEKNGLGGSPDRKRIDYQKLLTLLALIFAAITAAGIIAIVTVARRIFGEDVNVPLAAAITVTVAGGFMTSLCIVFSIVLLIKDSKNIEEETDVQYAIDPSVLKDTRIKQLPDVQRLMRYESVQNAFSEGKIPDDPKAASDPHLQELINVLSQLADDNGVIKP